MNTVSEAFGFPVFDASSSLERFLVVDEKVQFPIFIFLRISKV